MVVAALSPRLVWTVRRWTFDDSLNGFTITTMRAIDRGEQVYDSYGRKCNSRFFVNYGFALEDNEEDNEALLAFACPPDAPSLARKNQMAAGKNLLSLREFQVPATSGHTHAHAHTHACRRWLRTSG